MADDELNRLWDEYQLPFSQFDDHTLARWMSQTLGQLEGGIWRLSHPLLGAYRVAAEQGNERQIWLKRLANPPSSFPPAECCRAPLMPVFSRDVLNSGLICQHCGATAVELSELPQTLHGGIRAWAEEYALVHAVAHYDEERMRELDDYDEAFEMAASQAEALWRRAALELLPPLLDYYPLLLWEDQDECLEVEPKDIKTWE